MVGLRQVHALTVTTLVDEKDGSVTDGDVSLRDALALAPQGDTITFSSANGGTIKLTLGELKITKALTIQGTTLPMVVDASGNDPTPAVKNGDGSRAFLVDDGNPGNSAVVVLKGLTLIGADSNGEWGAVFSLENLRIEGGRIDGNATTKNGGAVCSAGSKLVLTRTILANNSCGIAGGAVFVANGFNKLLDCFAAGNRSGGDGGAVLNADGSSIQILRLSATANKAGVVTGNGKGAACAAAAAWTSLRRVPQQFRLWRRRGDLRDRLEARLHQIREADLEQDFKERRGHLQRPGRSLDLFQHFRAEQRFRFRRSPVSGRGEQPHS